ncbi:hypothetical protein M0R45_019821 [Rubus argutus]|uniref:Secreted protein n=1 Tax=Rubus argutus TaxID=59490 RepID=A0AAW1X859_RUBAR
MPLHFSPFSFVLLFHVAVGLIKLNGVVNVRAGHGDADDGEEGRARVTAKARAERGMERCRGLDAGGVDLGKRDAGASGGAAELTAASMRLSGNTG